MKKVIPLPDGGIWKRCNERPGGGRTMYKEAWWQIGPERVGEVVVLVLNHASNVQLVEASLATGVAAALAAFAVQIVGNKEFKLSTGQAGDIERQISALPIAPAQALQAALGSTQLAPSIRTNCGSLNLPAVTLRKGRP